MNITKNQVYVVLDSIFSYFVTQMILGGFFPGLVFGTWQDIVTGMGIYFVVMLVTYLTLIKFKVINHI